MDLCFDCVMGGWDDRCMTAPPTQGQQLETARGCHPNNLLSTRLNACLEILCKLVPSGNCLCAGRFVKGWNSRMPVVPRKKLTQI